MSPSESALLKGSWAGIEDMAYRREIRTAEAAYRVSAVFPATKIEGGGKRVRGCSKDRQKTADQVANRPLSCSRPCSLFQVNTHP